MRRFPAVRNQVATNVSLSIWRTRFSDRNPTVEENWSSHWTKEPGNRKQPFNLGNHFSSLSGASLEALTGWLRHFSSNRKTLTSYRFDNGAFCGQTGCRSGWGRDERYSSSGSCGTIGVSFALSLSARRGRDYARMASVTALIIAAASVSHRLGRTSLSSSTIPWINGCCT